METGSFACPVCSSCLQIPSRSGPVYRSPCPLMPSHLTSVLPFLVSSDFLTLLLSAASTFPHQPADYDYKLHLLKMCYLLQQCSKLNPGCSLLTSQNTNTNGYRSLSKYIYLTFLFCFIFHLKLIFYVSLFSTLFHVDLMPCSNMLL